MILAGKVAARLEFNLVAFFQFYSFMMTKMSVNIVLYRKYLDGVLHLLIISVPS